MPAFAFLRRTKPLLATAHSLPVEVPPVGRPPRLIWEAFGVRPLLQVGDYQVGETFCPRLSGHPGIRY